MGRGDVREGLSLARGLGMYSKQAQTLDVLRVFVSPRGLPGEGWRVLGWLRKYAKKRPLWIHAQPSGEEPRVYLLNYCINKQRQEHLLLEACE